MANSHSPPDVATVYQTRGQTHDLALTVKENKSRLVGDKKIYSCINNAYALIDNNVCNRLGIDVLRLQLLIRERLALYNIKKLREDTSKIEVSFDVDEYMRLVGYSNNYNSTQKANVVRNINNALTILQCMLFRIGNARNYQQFSILDKITKNGDLFKVELKPEFVKLVVASADKKIKDKVYHGKGLFSKFSRSIYALSNADDIRVLFCLEAHYSIINNVKNSINGRLSISTVNEFLRLPRTKAEVKNANSTNYYKAMIAPTISSLERLKQNGLIDYYLYEKGQDKAIDYERFENLKHVPERMLDLRIHYRCLELDKLNDSNSCLMSCSH